MHLKQNTVPDDVCPAGMDDSWGMDGNTVTVKAGQEIGRVGNTGNSSAPHLHLEVLADPPPGNPGANPRANGVPVLFQNVLVRGDKKDFNPETGEFEWTHAHGHAMGWDSIMLPNRCGFTPIPSGKPEYARHAITASCYQDVVNRATAAGYRPVWVDGHTVAGKTYYNAIFRPTDGTPYVARHGLTAAQHQAKFDQLTADGWRPVNISGVSDAGVMRYYALYEKKSLGRQPIYLNAFSHAGQSYLSAVFSSATTGTLAARHGMTSAEYQAEWTKWTGADYLTRHVTGYDGGGAARYAAIWRP